MSLRHFSLTASDKSWLKPLHDLRVICLVFYYCDPVCKYPNVLLLWHPPLVILTAIILQSICNWSNVSPPFFPQCCYSWLKPLLDLRVISLVFYYCAPVCKYPNVLLLWYPPLVILTAMIYQSLWNSSNFFPAIFSLPVSAATADSNPGA